MVKRAPFLPPPLAVRFSAFFLPTCCLVLSPVPVLLALSLSRFLLFFFCSGERGRPREITRPPWAPARPSRAQRSLLSQFANRAPGSRIVHLHFTIFRSEINTAPSAPHHSILSRAVLVSLTWLSSRAPAGFWTRSPARQGTARPTDPENRQCGRRPCEIPRSVEIDARSPID